ncbi:hypothetical protein ACFRR6_24490 [Streptomyces sp. NPDC056891]|uniref:hypothetical protein n=1 Tax=Streptomyces sp. NPDC056891 TaxID=3345961 RepID=UPI00369997F4
MAEGASPISSGGAGTVFEYRVAALDLVALLCCLPVPGLEAVPDEVGLQKACAAPLDDVVVSHGQGPHLLLVERQVKRTLEIVPSAKAWKGLIEQCLKSLERFGADVDADRRRFGVTATGPTEDLETLRELAATAQAHHSLDSFLDEAMPPLGAQYHRVWRHLKTTVANASTTPGDPPPAAEFVELTAFRIVRRLVVQIEAEGPGDRYRHLCMALEDRLIPDGAVCNGAEVFRIVEGLAAEWGPRGGSVTRAMLRNRLSAKGLVLLGDPPARADLKAAEQWTDTFLDRPQVKDRLGGTLHLDRVGLRAELAATIDAHELVLVTGPAGTGKSALTRAVAAELWRSDQATVVGLSLTDHTWGTVGDIDSDLGGPGRLATALRGAPTGRRLLVVDGAEQVLSDDGRLLSHLLSLLPRGEDGESLWHVVAVAREQAADAVRGHLAGRGGHVETMTVGDITPAESMEVLTAFPGLRPLTRSPRAARLLRTLYTVELLVKLPEVVADPERLVGEEDVAELVYEHLVCRGQSERPGLGHPDDRSEVYLSLAEEVFAGERFSRLRYGTGPAKQGLVSDGILVRERSAFRFAHDVLQDYAVATLLCEPGPTDLTVARSPRRLLRAVRIAAQLRLARAGHLSPADVVAAWNWIADMMRQLPGGDADIRWQDVPFEALFELGRPEQSVTALADVLLADGGRALVGAALRRLRTAVPALPVLRFLTVHAADLDVAAADGALRLLARWLPAPHRLDKDLAAGVPSAVHAWFQGASSQAEPAAIALARTARCLGESGRQTFEEICAATPLAMQQVLEDPVLADNMARHAPELLALAARSFYLDQARGARSVFIREGVQSLGWPVQYRPPAIEQLPTPVPPSWVPSTAPDPSCLGPFEALLAHAPGLGLAVAGQILDAATDAVTRIETERGEREFSLVWPLAQGNKVFTGTARSWRWPWAGSLGPGPAIAAAARLHRWAHNQAAVGADLGELVEQLLGCGRSIALVAIAVGVLARNEQRVDDELDPVLGQVDLWALPHSDAVQLEFALPLIVVRASVKRQDAYREMAHSLMAEHERRRTTGGEDAKALDDVITEAALLLDSSNFQIVDLPDGSGRVLVNEALLRRHQARQQNSFLEVFTERLALLNDAGRARDGAEETDAAALFDRWVALDRVHQEASADRPDELDQIGPMVAAVVVKSAATKAGAVEQWQVQWAANVLLGAAAATPQAITADWDVEIRELDFRAADRSAAMALPILLSTPGLLDQAALTEEAVRAAVLQLAGSAYIEVRSLLCEAFTRLWDEQACSGPHRVLHTAGIEALFEMAATAGLTVQEDADVPRTPFRLPDPVEAALTEGTAFVNLQLVGYTAPAAYLAAVSDCPHSRDARRLAEALAEHDRLTWTSQSMAMASGSAMWRRTHDAVTAQLALDANRGRLAAYLTAFDADPSALAGLLFALGEQATSQARVRELLGLWPDMLNRFANRGTEELGQALLPRPTQQAPWSLEQARGLLSEWAFRHGARPHLADHLLEVLDAHGLLGGREVSLVLDVLGDRAAAVAVSSRRAARFLARALAGDHQADERARRLLDALAALGHEEALEVQHVLEESTDLT